MPTFGSQEIGKQSLFQFGWWTLEILESTFVVLSPIGRRSAQDDSGTMLNKHESNMALSRSFAARHDRDASHRSQSRSLASLTIDPALRQRGLSGVSCG